MGDSILIQRANKAAEEYRQAHPETDAKYRNRVGPCGTGEAYPVPGPLYDDPLDCTTCGRSLDEHFGPGLPCPDSQADGPSETACGEKEQR